MITTLIRVERRIRSVVHAAAFALRHENTRTLVRWLGDTVGLDTLLTALLDAYGPDSVMRSLVEAGVLEESVCACEAGEPCADLYSVNWEADHV